MAWINNPYIVQMLVLVGGLLLFTGGNALMNIDQNRRIRRLKIFRP